MPRGPTRPYPGISITEASKIPQAICDSNAGRPMNRVLLAQSLNYSPAGTIFRDLITASGKYGFTEGNYNSETIELTDLGVQLTKPRSDTEKLEAQRKAFRNTALFEQLLGHYNNNKLPVRELLKNVLEREPFKVAPEWSEEAVDVFIANGKAVGFIRDISGSPWVVTEAGPPMAPVAQPSSVVPEQPTATAEIPARDDTTSPSKTPVSQNHEASPAASSLQFFIGHGKDAEALEQLKQILNQLGIPYVVAQEEPNKGRPISRKVKDLMDSCSAGIFVFSADEEFKDSSGNPIFRPRENVVYELGAASYKYDQRIVVFKEKGVAFPSDFRDLGYIEYDKSALSSKTMELLKELIALKAVRLLPGT